MTCVYVIAAEGGPVKVGIAKNPQARLRDLGTGTPFRLRLAHIEDPEEFAAVKVERAAHALLAATRTHGEWFAVTVDEARLAIQNAIDELRRLSVSPLDGAFTERHEKGCLIVTASIRQVKAARALLGWSQSELARRSGVSEPTIKRLEATDSHELIGGRRETASTIQRSLEAAGVKFTNDGGPGVKMRKSE